MTECLRAELVLTRGPVTLPRCIELRVPTDGTRITVGRAPDNDVVLDMNLLFASQRHCQLLVRPAATNDDGAAVENTATKKRRGNGRKRAREEVQQQQQQARLELCVVDVGSSNGTFVNGVRVGEGVATPLRHGDAVVLGGMRDIPTNASMPAEAVADAPEIVTWRVALNDDDDGGNHHGSSGEEFGFEAVPPVFPHVEFAEAEEKRLTLALLQTASRSLQQEQPRAVSPASASHTSAAVVSPPPTVMKRWDEAHQEHHRQQQQQQQEGLPLRGESPQTPAAREVLRRNSSEDKDEKDDEAASAPHDMDSSTRRSGTIAAEVVLRARSAASAPPPSAVVFSAVRVGALSFVVPPASPTPTQPRRSTGRAKRVGNNSAASRPHTLSFTHTHLKWAMEGAVRGKRRVTVDCTIPWRAVAQVMYCTPCRGLVVRLQRGSQPPLLDPGVVAEESSFAAWLLDAEAKGGESEVSAVAEAEAEADGVFRQLLHEMEQFCMAHKGPAPQPVEEAEFLTSYAPAA
ncbi:hypothetical protein DQ04_04711040 [Trypanosoma grayi]|uniref:hypothetical protein n=1 Tax=Trypanosoma grayi TaxID=71804 RepID=UPI0004F40005|nr:hypothetical protein DQ04_04711040 [Trypanosoma grayi]KEG09751.1 hypothetical protein DQ04_04711040 [Trypanosoma grayi]